MRACVYMKDITSETETGVGGVGSYMVGKAGHVFLVKR